MPGWDNFKTEYDDTPNHDDNDNENEIPINVRPELPSISILDTLTWDNFKSEYDDTPNHDDNDN